MLIYLIFPLLLFNFQLVSEDIDIKELIQKLCPKFDKEQDNCMAFAKKLKEEQDKLKDNPIFDYLNKIESSKKKYDESQKKAQDCRLKSTPKCNESATIAFDSLSKVNKTNAAIMKILHKYYSFIPLPKEKIEEFEGFKYTVVPEYDKTNFFKAVNLLLDREHIFDEPENSKTPPPNRNILPLLKDLKYNNDLFTKYYGLFEDCLTKLSTECDPLTKVAYQELTNLNNNIAQAMTSLNKLYPNLIDKPKLKVITLEGDKENKYSYTTVENFNGDKFTAAITQLRKDLINPVLVGQLEDCQKDLTDCQNKLKTHLDNIKAEAEAKLIPTIATDIVLSLGTFVAVEEVLIVFGVPGLSAMAIALVLTSIVPGLDELTEQVADWIVDGIFAIFNPHSPKLNIPRVSIASELHVVDIKRERAEQIIESERKSG